MLFKYFSCLKNSRLLVCLFVYNVTVVNKVKDGEDSEYNKVVEFNLIVMLFVF